MSNLLLSAKIQQQISICIFFLLVLPLVVAVVKWQIIFTTIS